MYTPITPIKGYITVVIGVYTGYYGPQISRNNVQIMLILRKLLTPLQKNTKRYTLNEIFPQMQVLSVAQRAKKISNMARGRKKLATPGIDGYLL